MARCPDPAAAERFCAERRAAGLSVGLVPTMGALHEGHLELVRRAARENDLAVVSVFVNPLQFDDPRDLAAYPVDFESDARLLEGAGCAMAFTGTLEGFFPEAGGRPPEPLDPGPFAVGLEGEHRAGHFAGVATIVARLFALVRPARAYFGAKDFQQTLVVGDVARRLGGPEVVVCPTVRDADGLALSSRNLRLSPIARARARAIPRALEAARARWADGERGRAALERTLADGLVGLDVEYAVVRSPSRWGEAPARLGPDARALVAARVGGVRLIDNRALADGSP